MPQPLRINVRFSPSEGITYLVPSREARVYDCGVGPREDRSALSVATAPTMSLSSGPLRQSRRFHHMPRRLCCVTRVLRGSLSWGVWIGRV